MESYFLKINIIESYLSKKMKMLIALNIFIMAFSFLFIIIFYSEAIYFRIILIALFIIYLIMQRKIRNTKSYKEIGELIIADKFLFIETNKIKVKIYFSEINTMEFVFTGFKGQHFNTLRSPWGVHRGNKNYLIFETNKQTYQLELFMPDKLQLRKLNEILKKAIHSYNFSRYNQKKISLYSP